MALHRKAHSSVSSTVKLIRSLQNLDDFKSRSCFTRFSYGWLWFLGIVSVAVYAVDTFTAINLLAFDRWSSQVNPAIPFKVSKWIFAVCILLSWVLLGFEFIRAIRVIRRNGVAESYLDPLAVVLQSMRLGQGKGWRRFLVFAELTKSKKGVDYLALFVYFSFKGERLLNSYSIVSADANKGTLGAIRVLLAETPRQFVNAVTLVSVAKADLVPAGQPPAGSAIKQFFDNIKILAQTNSKQAIILGSMSFTFVIWFLSALSLLFALVFYVFFLWHYVPSSDGRLSIYCRRKINRRLGRIVGVKVKKALEDEERKQRKQQLKEDRDAIKKGIRPTAQRQPTLPTLEDSKEDKYAESILSRSTSQSTLPPYISRPPTRNGSNPPALQRQPTLPGIEEDALPPPFARMDTSSSVTSLDSNAPLLSDAAGMGASEPVRRPLSNGSRDYFGRPGMNRNMSSASQMSGPPSTPAPSYHSNGYRPGGPSRQNTQGSTTRTFGPPLRTNTQESFGRPYGPLRQNTGFSVASNRQGVGDSYEMSPQTPGNIEQSPADRSYTPYNPNQPASATPFSNNMTPSTDYFTPRATKRSVTDPYNPSMYDDYGAANVSPAPGPMPTRSATAGPNIRGGYGPVAGAPQMGPSGMNPPGRRPMPNPYASRSPM